MIFDSRCGIIKMVIVVSEKCILHQRGVDPFYKIWHTTGENMIMYIHSGSGNIVTAEGSYEIGKGTLCFIGADKFHYTLPDNPEDYDRTKISLSDETFSKVLSMLPKEKRDSKSFKSTTLTYAKIDESAQKIVETIIDDIENTSDPESRDIVILGGYLRLMLFIYNNVLQTSVSGGALQLAIDYINTHISQEITIDKICETVHISKYHFCRKFKAIVGSTVMDYVLKTRIAKAKNMLSTTDFSVGDISEKCGFCSIAYFCRVFKENEGLSPLKYRKTNTNN